MTLEVRETAGIRRFGYPVETELRFDPPVPSGSRFRLLEDEGRKVIVSQFRPLEEKDGRVVRAALDFEGSFLPFEARKYAVEYGPDVEAGAEPGGLSLEESGDVFRIANGPHLVWEVPRNLSTGEAGGGSGLFRSVKSAKLDFLRPDSLGLCLRWRDGKLRPLRSSSPGTVVKRGPLACRLRFEVETDGGGAGPVRSVVEVEIPRSRSWARVDWSLADPRGESYAMGAQIHLRLEGDAAFADFGAGTLVYAALSRGQGASFRAGLAVPDGPGGKAFWEVLRGPPGKLEPYVSGGPAGAREVEGWAHLMDRERCTAVAVAEFAKGSGDRIDVDQSGLLQIWREPAAKSLRFWIHFVDFPPHLGAVTSPQSMASPLEIKR
jgi:hypothetical protein